MNGNGAGRTRRPSRDGWAPASGSIPLIERDVARVRELAALVRLAAADRVLQPSLVGRRQLAADPRCEERPVLAARLSLETREVYDRALRGGRQPAVVSLVGGVCTGCHVRLPATLELKVRRRRGVGACPHCLRLVYDPAWLD